MRLKVNLLIVSFVFLLVHQSEGYNMVSWVYGLLGGWTLDSSRRISIPRNSRPISSPHHKPLILPEPPKPSDKLYPSIEIPGLSVEDWFLAQMAPYGARWHPSSSNGKSPIDEFDSDTIVLKPYKTNKQTKKRLSKEAVNMQKCILFLSPFINLFQEFHANCKSCQDHRLVPETNKRSFYRSCSENCFNNNLFRKCGNRVYAYLEDIGEITQNTPRGLQYYYGQINKVANRFDNIDLSIYEDLFKDNFDDVEESASSTPRTVDLKQSSNHTRITKSRINSTFDYPIRSTTEDSVTNYPENA